MANWVWMTYNNSFAPQSCTTINAHSSQNIYVGVYGSIKQHKLLFIWPVMNYKILKFDKINWSCFLALFVQKRWSISDVPGEDGGFLFVLVKSYEQDGDTLQNKFKQQESRWYLLGRLTYFWQQITLFSISEMPLLHCHLIVFVLATVSFCILLNFLFVVLFCFFEDKTIMRYFQRGQEELITLTAAWFRLDHWQELAWHSKAIDVLVLLVLRWSVINQLNKWARVAVISSANDRGVWPSSGGVTMFLSRVSASFTRNVDVPQSKMSPIWLNSVSVIYSWFTFSALYQLIWWPWPPVTTPLCLALPLEMACLAFPAIAKHCLVLLSQSDQPT